MTGDLLLRDETPADIPAVRALNEAAFEQPSEARLVDTLRGQVTPLLSLVAVSGEEVVGHILFTPVQIGDATTALALGPMAVLPARQRQGVGGALVRAGLQRCQAVGHPVVFVLGHPEFYPRFGFVPAGPLGLTCKWEVPTDVWMVAELSPGALEGLRGEVRYHAVFDAV